MGNQRFTCPECSVTFEAVPAPSGMLACPVCDAKFSASGATAGPALNTEGGPPAAKPAVAAIASPAPAAITPAAPPAPAAIAPMATSAPMPAASQEAKPFSGRGRLAVVLAVVLLLVGSAVAVMAVMFKGSGSPTVATTAPTNVANVNPPPPPTQVSSPPTRPAKPLDTRPRPPTDQQKRINQAIDFGVAYLKRDLEELLAAPDDRHDFATHYNEGMLAMDAWTLLSCGVPATDPLIEKTAALLRERLDRPRHVYCISLMIFFFDKLGQKQDDARIRRLGLRLIAGQHASGNWAYQCPILTPPEDAALTRYLESLNYLKSSIGEGVLQLKPGARMDLPESLHRLSVVVRLKPFSFPKKLKGIQQGDNSNTQFAVLALWVAKRHGTPVAPSLALIDRFFRRTQRIDGSWTYYVGNRPEYGDFKASMTCAGLVGLAVARGLHLHPGEEAPTPDGRPRDAAIQRGLTYLGGTVRPVEPARTAKGTYFGADAGGDLYYLWSLERVAVIYDLKMIGGQDWYAWAPPRHLLRPPDPPPRQRRPGPDHRHQEHDPQAGPGAVGRNEEVIRRGKSPFPDQRRIWQYNTAQGVAKAVTLGGTNREPGANAARHSRRFVPLSGQGRTRWREDRAADGYRTPSQSRSCSNIPQPGRLCRPDRSR
jgi:hypothetical protein